LLTIAWNRSASFAEGQWPALQTRLFDHLIRYLRCQGIPAAFVWVRERARGMGPHTHALVHLGRKPTAVWPRLRARLDHMFRFDPTGIDISMGAHGAKTATMRAGMLRYVCKGIDHAAFRYVGLDGETENIAAALGIRHRGQQGIVEIKRCGTSQNIGPAARRQAGWTEIRDIASLNRSLNPLSDGHPFARGNG